jgi:hypothetical protein
LNEIHSAISAKRTLGQFLIPQNFGDRLGKILALLGTKEM